MKFKEKLCNFDYWFKRVFWTDSVKPFIVLNMLLVIFILIASIWPNFSIASLIVSIIIAPLWKDKWDVYMNNSSSKTYQEAKSNLTMSSSAEIIVSKKDDN